MIPERAKLALGAALLLLGVASGIWFTERLREFPGPPLVVAVDAFDNATGNPALDDALDRLLDEGRFVRGEDADYALAGSAAAEGAGYHVEVRVTELASAEVLAVAGTTVSGQEAIPPALEELSAELRRKLAQAGR